LRRQQQQQRRFLRPVRAHRRCSAAPWEAPRHRRPPRRERRPPGPSSAPRAGAAAPRTQSWRIPLPIADPAASNLHGKCRSTHGSPRRPPTGGSGGPTAPGGSPGGGRSRGPRAPRRQAVSRAHGVFCAGARARASNAPRAPALKHPARGALRGGGGVGASGVSGGLPVFYGTRSRPSRSANRGSCICSQAARLRSLRRLEAFLAVVKV
jgi:hypothetical protein